MSRHNGGYIKDAYKQLCKDTAQPDGVWLTLYVSVPFYGGPEEGGWWGEDNHVVETMRFTFEDEAEKVREAVKVRAEELNQYARRQFGDQCLRELEWLESRGLESDYLPEPDGESRYWVTVERQRGSQESTGSRHWE